VEVIVLGAGAAGLMCALTAGQSGRRVLLLEQNERVGQKIAISGGGRCNFTNLQTAPENYLSQNPDFCRSALARFTPADFTALVEKHGIAYHEKKLGQLFCDKSSREIIDLLLEECRLAGVEIRVGCRVQSVCKGERFSVATNLGTFIAPALVVATGGLSFPKLGATDFGHRLARQFGLRLTELRPGLVPLTFADSTLETFADLTGVALPVRLRHPRQSFAEALLFTHRGLSGPAVLQASSYWREGESLSVELASAVTAEELLTGPGDASFRQRLSHHFPRRFAEVWSAQHAPAKPIAQWNKAEVQKVARLLTDWPLTPTGTEGYPKAEVTCGGVDTRDLSSKTMESRAVPGLYFIGEVVDVTGWLGGYNFQWAWASGHAAGVALGKLEN
jgi:predicted Rossmann fold flavoprotein